MTSDTNTAQQAGGSVPVLIIGAGPAGLSSAYYLQRLGIPYRIVERTDKVGSTWSALYPSLRLNTANFVSNLPGMPVYWRGGFYMTGRQFYDHLRAFAEKHQFEVEFGVTVERVSREGDGYRVELVSANGRETAWYPCVIVATGKFSNPQIPPIEGIDSYTGQVLHAGAFNDFAPFADQRVLIVGSGPSGGDIAAAMSEVTRKPPVYLAIRSDIIIARRYPYGLPDTLWKILTGFLPDRFGKWLWNKISYQSFDEVRRLNLPTAPNREDRRGTSAPVRGRELVDALWSGRVKAVAGLARFVGEKRVMLMDDTALDVDAVIMATGYLPAIDYLDFPFETDKDGWFVRAEGQEAAGYAGLYLVGRFYQGLGPLYNIKHEAEIAANQIAARLKQD